MPLAGRVAPMIPSNGISDPPPELSLLGPVKCTGGFMSILGDHDGCGVRTHPSEDSGT